MSPLSVCDAQGSSTEDLAKASQNPVADLISVPLQYNANFNTGPFDRTQHVLNIQPVLPMRLNAEWNIISRTIIPLISQPDPLVESSTDGIGDITQSFFLSPAHPGSLIWGVGPVFTMPSASHPLLGTGKVLLGPTAVALVTPGHWVIGALVNNQWSVGGDSDRKSVNVFLAQPFINYNFPDGWFVTTSPIITADWTFGPAMDRPPWWRDRSRVQDRGSAGQCPACHLRQRRPPGWGRGLAAAASIRVSIPDEIVHARCKGRSSPPSRKVIDWNGACWSSAE